MHKSEKVSLYSVLLNILLFTGKIIIGVLSHSLAVLSDAFNSLLDILSYTGVYIAVKESNKRADKSHPFGHHRAEPIAGLVIAIFAGILSFEIAKNAVLNFYRSVVIEYSAAAIIVLLIAIVLKTGMFLYLKKEGEKLKRPAIKAAAIDSKNDVLGSFVALFGLIGATLGFPMMDSIAAIFISISILYSGYEIARENINYLMGHAPDEDILKKIKKKTLTVKGVKGFNEVNAHFVGPYVHVEIHIEVDKGMETQKSHDIGKKVQLAVQKLDEVDKAFIHVDPV